MDFGPCTAITAYLVCWFSKVRECGALADIRDKTSAAFAAFGIKKISFSECRYAIRSSTTPPLRWSHNKVYCAWPSLIFERSLVNIEFKYWTAPSPFIDTLPKCETSNNPTFCLTAWCSFITPPPEAAGYSIGISHPPKSAIFAPAERWKSCSGE